MWYNLISFCFFYTQCLLLLLPLPQIIVVSRHDLKTHAFYPVLFQYRKHTEQQRSNDCNEFLEGRYGWTAYTFHLTNIKPKHAHTR